LERGPGREPPALALHGDPAQVGAAVGERVWKRTM
jgi:hypothetical protein